MNPINLRKYSILTLKTLIVTAILLFGYYWLFLRPELIIWEKVQKNEQILIVQKNYLSQSRIIMVELIKSDVNDYYYPTHLKKTLELLSQINNTALKKSKETISYDPVLSLGRKNIRAYNRNILSGIYKITEENKVFLSKQKEMLSNLQLLNFDQQKEFLHTNQVVPLLTEQTNLTLEYDYWLNQITVLKRSL
ncbi:MAG: hypothetical protein Q8O88_06175 [bacterium]|nr:hypothetical protein [bacterium]